MGIHTVNYTLPSGKSKYVNNSAVLPVKRKDVDHSLEESLEILSNVRKFIEKVKRLPDGDISTNYVALELYDIIGNQS